MAESYTNDPEKQESPEPVQTNEIYGELRGLVKPSVWRSAVSEAQAAREFEHNLGLLDRSIRIVCLMRRFDSERFDRDIKIDDIQWRAYAKYIFEKADNATQLLQAASVFRPLDPERFDRSFWKIAAKEGPRTLWQSIFNSILGSADPEQAALMLAQIKQTSPDHYNYITPKLPAQLSWQKMLGSLSYQENVPLPHVERILRFAAALHAIGEEHPPIRFEKVSAAHTSTYLKEKYFKTGQIINFIEFVTLTEGLTFSK